MLYTKIQIAIYQTHVKLFIYCLTCFGLKKYRARLDCSQKPYFCISHWTDNTDCHYWIRNKENINVFLDGIPTQCQITHAFNCVPNLSRLIAAAWQKPHRVRHRGPPHTHPPTPIHPHPNTHTAISKIHMKGFGRSAHDDFSFFFHCLDDCVRAFVHAIVVFPPCWYHRTPIPINYRFGCVSVIFHYDRKIVFSSAAHPFEVAARSDCSMFWLNIAQRVYTSMWCVSIRARARAHRVNESSFAMHAASGWCDDCLGDKTGAPHALAHPNICILLPCAYGKRSRVARDMVFIYECVWKRIYDESCAFARTHYGRYGAENCHACCTRVCLFFELTHFRPPAEQCTYQHSKLIYAVQQQQQRQL